MSEQYKNPNQDLNPKTLSRVIKASQTILDLSGILDESPSRNGRHMQSATVPLETSELTNVPVGVKPTISINRPVGDFAKDAKWSYEISYGMQNPSASRHILVMNNEVPEAEMSFYDGSADRPLTEVEAQAVAADLSRIASIEA